MSNTINTKKRDDLVTKYDLMNFPNLKEPVFLTIDEFFDGNNDEASIAPNLTKKPKVSEYYTILKNISKNPKIVGAFAEIKDVIIYQNGKLNDNEWFYTDVIYFIGDISKEEIQEATKSLFPDEVNYDTDSGVEKLDDKFKSKKIVSVWWD
ncbi:MAG: hypothetical protein QM737_21985 [Ferruginibacter sp.]